MFVSVGGKQMYLWRAVDAEGEVLAGGAAPGQAGHEGGSQAHA
jgi:hypothetical protein